MVEQIYSNWWVAPFSLTAYRRTILYLCIALLSIFGSTVLCMLMVQFLF